MKLKHELLELSWIVQRVAIELSRERIYLFSTGPMNEIRSIIRWLSFEIQIVRMRQCFECQIEIQESVIWRGHSLVDTICCHNWDSNWCNEQEHSNVLPVICHYHAYYIKKGG